MFLIYKVIKKKGIVGEKRKQIQHVQNSIVYAAYVYTHMHRYMFIYSNKVDREIS